MTTCKHFAISDGNKCKCESCGKILGFRTKGVSITEMFSSQDDPGGTLTNARIEGECSTLYAVHCDDLMTSSNLILVL